MKNRILVLAALLLVGCAVGRAQVEDSVDVIDYDLTLDLSDGAPFSGVPPSFFRERCRRNGKFSRGC